MKRLLALCLLSFFITTTWMTFGLGTLSDSLAEGCFIQGYAESFSAADSVLAGNLNWVRPCTSPEQFKADSKGCEDWALMRSNMGMRGLYIFCMQSRGYSPIPLNQVSRNCWNNAPLVPESCCGCSICGKYTLSHDGRARVIETIPENIPLPQWGTCPRGY